MRPIAHHTLTIAASQAGIRRSRIDPRHLLASRALNSWTLTSRQPSMTRRSPDQHAPPAASGAKGSLTIAAAIRVRTIFITSAAPATARSGNCSSDAETRSCAHAGNPWSARAAAPTSGTARRAQSGAHACQTSHRDTGTSLTRPRSPVDAPMPAAATASIAISSLKQSVSCASVRLSIW